MYTLKNTMKQFMFNGVCCCTTWSIRQRFEKRQHHIFPEWHRFYGKRHIMQFHIHWKNVFHTNVRQYHVVQQRTPFRLIFAGSDMSVCNVWHLKCKKIGCDVDVIIYRFLYIDDRFREWCLVVIEYIAWKIIEDFVFKDFEVQRKNYQP